MIINKYPKILIMIIILITVPFLENIAYCGTVGADNNTTALQEFIRSLNREELAEFERHLNIEPQQGWEQNNQINNNPNDFGWESLGLFIVGTLAIIIIARYGNNIWDTLRNIASDVVNSMDHLALDAARNAVLNRVDNMLANPNNGPRIQHAVEAIQAMRNNHHA